MRGEGKKQYFFHGDSLISADVIFVGADTPSDSGMEGGVHAFERATGKERWKYASGRGVLARMIGDETKLFALTTERKFVCLNAEDGQPIWSFPLAWSAWESCAFADNRVLVGSDDGSISALDVQNGSVTWRTDLGARVSTSIQMHRENAYLGTADGKIYGIAVRNGEIVGIMGVDSKLKPAGLPVAWGSDLLVLLVDDGNDYRELISLDPNLKKILWRLGATDKWSTSRIFIHQDSVVLGEKSGQVTGYSCSNGQRIWSLSLAGTIRSIGGADGILYVGTTEGNLYAVRPPLRSSGR